MFSGESFVPALKTLRGDKQGRVNVGSVSPAAKGGRYYASVDAAGRVLLTPVTDETTDPAAITRAVERAGDDSK